MSRKVYGRGQTIGKPQKFDRLEVGDKVGLSFPEENALLFYRIVGIDRDAQAVVMEAPENDIADAPKRLRQQLWALALCPIIRGHTHGKYREIAP